MSIYDIKQVKVMNLRIFILLAVTFNIANIFGQTDSVYSFSLKEAREYALKNNLNLRSSQIDLELAKRKIWETTAIGLPQAKGSIAYSYSITEPKISELFKGMFGSPYDTVAAEMPEFDFKSSTSLDITVSQLIFNGAYIVGLQTSKTFKALSEFSIEKSVNDLTEQVTNNYFLVLTLRENKDIVDSTLINTEKLFAELKQNYEVGFVEETDVDQIGITLNRIRNLANNLDRQTGIAEKLLKFTLGIDLVADILLTESLEDYIESPGFLTPLSTEFIVEDYPDYQVLQTQEKLMKLNLRLQKSNVLPTVSAFYAYHKQLNENYVDFQPENMVGIQVSMPLFTSGQNYMKIRQAKLSLYQTSLNVRTAAEGFQLAFEQARSDYLAALDRYYAENDNIRTAGKIYERAVIKYKEGIIGSMELTQTQNQYLQAQSDFYTAIGDLVAAKSKMEKMTGEIN
jgi:outer membrane protein TolC